MIHSIYILSNEGEPIFTKEYSKSDFKITELSNFVSAIADFASQFSEKNKNDGFSSFVLGKNGFIFHRDAEFTVIAVIDAQLDSSDISKIKKVYKRFRDKHQAITKNGKSDKIELENFEKEVFKIIEGNTDLINFQALDDLLWGKNSEN
ncbi:MAG: hypothetical protein QW279_07640 [Candidatus Jordarchaeaceae archaeon]